MNKLKQAIIGVAAAIAVLSTSTSQADIISVNFHVGNDANAQADHVLVAGETAGFIPVTGNWNNINVGNAAAHNTAGPIFASTTLINDMGTTTGATLAPSLNSTWFVGYAANSASGATELGLVGNDDDLFNSYLALNGPSGDSSPADAAVLSISGLGAEFTDNGYDLVIYSDSDRRGNGSLVRQSVFTVAEGATTLGTVNVQDDEAAAAGTAVPTFDGTYIASTNTNSAISVIEYSNYTVLGGLTADSFTIDINSPDGGRGAISGFQIVAATAVPEPSSFACLGIAGLAAGLRRRRR